MFDVPEWFLWALVAFAAIGFVALVLVLVWAAMHIRVVLV